MADRRGGRGVRPPDPGAATYQPLPKRTRARKRIETPPSPLAAPVEGGATRRLSRAERARLRAQYEGRRALPPTVRPAQGRSGSHPWWTPVLVVGLIAVLGGSIGAGRFLASDPTPAPSPTPPAVAAVVPSPTATIEPTATATATATSTSTPEPTPTPDPRFVGVVVCLDPGHGGSDRGFTREENDVAPALEEAQLNLAYARAVRARLETLGFTVIMTRDADVDVNATGADVNGDGETFANMQAKGKDRAERAKDIDELQARIDICNDANADLLVSMHINGFDQDPRASGYETWYSSSRPFKARNILFAQLAFDALGEEMDRAGYNARARGVRDDQQANVVPKGDAFDEFVITGPEQKGKIVPSAMPGAIVEVLFLSNDEDAAFLASPKGRDAVVTAYAAAITRYFEQIAGQP